MDKLSAMANVFDLLALVGALLVTVGLWMILAPLALCWVGMLLLAVGVAGALRGGALRGEATGQGGPD